MAYRELLPHLALRPFVDRFWIEDGAAAPCEPALPRRILPDGCIDLLLDVGHGRAFLVGAMTRAVVIAGDQLSVTAAVRFRPGGAAPFLRRPAHELTDRQVTCAELDLAALVPPALGDLTDARVALEALQSTLLAQLRRLRDPAPDARIDHAVRSLLAGAGSIDRLARTLGCTRQHLRRAFRAQVGIGPKHFDRVARLQRTLTRLQAARSRGLAEIALEAGYFDQAHMTSDFRALAGITPAGARQAAGSIFPIQSLFGGA
jgi:AraC-like DNA-binding protein